MLCAYASRAIPGAALAARFVVVFGALAANPATPNLVAAEPPAVQPPAAERVDYARQVKPILAARCFACHGALKQEANLRLDTAALAQRGGEGGAALVAGARGKSALFAKIAAADPAERMPPEGEPLAAAQIELIGRWIDEGAAAPDDEQPEQDPRRHWAFVPPRRAPLPAVADPDWAGHPVDLFLAAEHRRLGLRPQGLADKRTLLRRVYLDLIGLPPTPAEQAAFLADTSPTAYEQVVDCLLTSPAHGERWGRHFMDIWRYSDAWGLGAEVRNSQKHIWHWRDWIIESLNQDVGYDEMLRQMLAADELYPTDVDKLRATGFLARQYFKFNRTSWLDEAIEHTSKAFLGLTYNCGKCHDHKYDPLSQVEYYRLRAIFEPHQIRAEQVAGETDYEKNAIPRAFDCNLDAPTYLFTRGDEKRPETDRPLSPGTPALFTSALGEFTVTPIVLPPEAHQPALRQVVWENYLGEAERQVAAARRTVEQARAARDQLAARRADQAAQPAATRTDAKPADAANDSSRQDDAQRVGAKQDGLAPEGDKPAAVKQTGATLTPLVSDDFAEPRPELWEARAGDWKHQRGALTQSKTGASRLAYRLKREVPLEFQATLRFTITGGEMWKSVGMVFDARDGREALVYLSAFAGGPKLQIAHKTEGDAYVYPPEAALVLPVKVGEARELTVRARGPLVNVALDGKHALAWRLPIPRRTGAFELITFDAQAEFRGFTLAALPADAALVEPSAAPMSVAAQPTAGTPTAAAQPVSLAAAEAALALAERALAKALAEVDALRARFAAERAKHAAPAVSTTPAVSAEQALSAEQAAKARELARAAVAAERRLALAQAEEGVARAELQLVEPTSTTQGEAAKRAEVEKQLVAARAARDKAAAALTPAALEAAGDKYTPPRGALKTLESNVESAASRDRPFPATSTGRRAAFARWLTDPRHPLTARVAVNHFWARHFGQPLVPTVFDFGRKGAAPTHPELLDWLAVELVEHDWSPRRVHRLLVTSRLYRLGGSTAGADAATLAADPDNRGLWRMPAARLEAQVIRDALWHVAGELDRRVGGPPVSPAQEELSRRRGLYFLHSHNEHHRWMAAFDDANVLECYRRSESIVPQQALALSNGRQALEAAEITAKNLDSDPTLAEDAAFTRAAFAAVLCAAPSEAEVAACVEALGQWQAAAANRPPAERHQRARANLVHALFNHNDFVTRR